MLKVDPPEQTVGTGLRALDAVLGGLYWGDNVVWALDGARAEPFYRPIARRDRAFELRAVVAVGSPAALVAPRLQVIDARPGSGLADPGDLLRAIHRLCRRPGRRLFLFEPLDSMVREWGLVAACEFFARACPLLLEAGAIAYWSVTVPGAPAALLETVDAIPQCVLHVDERSVRVGKAEGRDEGVLGTVLHWHEDGGRAVLEQPQTVDRLPASLQAVRHAHELSQHDLGELAGVTASAISQAERGERGLSLATLLRLSTALGVTIDDLLHAEDAAGYRIGRRSGDPQSGLDDTMTLLADAGANLRIDLVHLGARAVGRPPGAERGRAIVAVASGLVQVQVGGRRPAVRRGEVLVADGSRVEGWRNLRETEALLFWILAGGDHSPDRS